MSEASITEPKSSLSLLAGIVDRPSATLAEVTARPRWRWVLPMTLAILATIASAVVAAPFLAAEAKLQMAAVLSRMPAEQLAQMPKQMAMFQTPLFVGATAALTGILALLIGYLLQAAALYFGSLIAGGEIDFGRLFAATPWVGLPFVLETVMQTVYVAVKGKLVINQGLSYLVSTGSRTADAGSLAYAALGMLTLFWLWHLLLSFKLLRVGPRLGGGARPCGDAAVRGPQRGRASRFRRPEPDGEFLDVGSERQHLAPQTISREPHLPGKVRQSLFITSTPNGNAHDFPGWQAACDNHVCNCTKGNA